ncbi:MAG: bifunctional DNA primase/polymerase [Proteobacteria bacterium]|nr:bifunctional DNA primase/polymerase [Pseudomonadota bacterium]
MSEETLIREAAIRYARLGLSVVPLKARGKAPLVRWEDFQHRRASEAEVAAWFSRWPGANVGLVTGAVSGLVVLDVDPRHGGAESLAEWERRHGPLPDTVAATSGGGGRHHYFAAPHLGVRSHVGLAPGIDLRGEGGLVVAPPSIHPSGRHYAWVVERALGEAALAPLPAWLEAMARSGEGPRHGRPLAYWRALVRAGVKEGERNTTIASLVGHLLWHGVDPAVALELMLAWNRMRSDPPLADEEVAAVVESIARLHERERGRGREG